MFHFITTQVYWTHPIALCGTKKKVSYLQLCVCTLPTALKTHSGPCTLK